ncbi:hypothetical protein [Porphyromonas sp. COT-239 OH1446]|uniref:hypothetical protein n=1 Tax=Porphyromonas sp. COT-239 OH1446 TaxID=1515613 RepID=UPI00052BDA25|nr:hypothetical protein [Porphyromonas sp. COT-239 OH1446]KGN68331.1 hypothetical protein HQ37_06630 [Porphyromonas sp. COT-239 OH1446]
MPQEEREALLLQWAKEEQRAALKKRFKDFQLPTDSISVREYINEEKGKRYYIIRLFNKQAVRELRYEWLHTIKVTFADDDGSTCSVFMGSGIGYYPKGKPRYKPKSKGK